MHTSPYDRITHHHLDSFPGTIEGNEMALFCVVSTRPLSQQAHDALMASAGRLEYSPKQVCFITLTVTDTESDRPTTAPSSDDLPSTIVDTNGNQPATAMTTTSADQLAVTPRQLLEAIEAIDPLCVVLTDRKAVETASAGYNAPLSLETKEYLLGRGCCCCEDFEALLESDQGKRTAWNCLRTLPACFG